MLPNTAEAAMQAGPLVEQQNHQQQQQQGVAETISLSQQLVADNNLRAAVGELTASDTCPCAAAAAAAVATAEVAALQQQQQPFEQHAVPVDEPGEDMQQDVEVEQQQQQQLSEPQSMAVTGADKHMQQSSEEQQQQHGRGSRQPAKPRPTHFVALQVSHNPQVGGLRPEHPR
jgi:hypothetical protein